MTTRKVIYLGPFLSKSMLAISWAIAFIFILNMPSQGTVVHPGESIQAAIDAAWPGDLIEVENGTYRESIDINKPVVLRGLGYPVIDANGNDSAILLSADGTSIEGFVITKTSIIGSPYRAGIIADSNGNTIRANRVLNNSCGIFINGTRNNSVENNTVNGSILWGTGIWLDNCRDNLIEDNVVSHNRIIGICLNNSTGNKIIGNRIFDNADAFPTLGEFQYMAGAVGFLYGSRDNILRDNAIYGNYVNFGIFDPASNDIDASNTVEGRHVLILNGTAGMTIDSSSKAGLVFCRNCRNITIKGQEMTNNTFCIWLQNTTDSIVEGCRQKNSTWAIVLDINCTNITLENNHIEDCMSAISFSGSGCTIEGNAMERCGLGLSIESGIRADDGRGVLPNRILNNTISGGITGIDISLAKGDILKNNSMFGNLVNLDLGFGPPQINNEVGTSNLVNGKSVFCLKDAADMIVDSSSNAGMVVCSNCSNLTITGLQIEGSRTGIDIDGAKRLTISLCRISGCNSGIAISSSRNCSIEANSISNSGDGIRIVGSRDISVMDNSVSNISHSRWISSRPDAGKISERIRFYAQFTGFSYNEGLMVTDSNRIRLLNNTIRYSEGCGICLEKVKECTVAGSLAANNSKGIELIDSNKNTLFENQATYNEYGMWLSKSTENLIYSNIFSDNSIAHAFDDDGPNYWDDGTSGNYYRDLNCTDFNSNEICISPYSIPGGSSVDRYPLQG